MTSRYFSSRRTGAKPFHLNSANDQRRLVFEPLEDRRLLAVFTVDNLNDSGTGSLRDAITQANLTSAADVIEFSVTGAIDIASQLPRITETLTINGPGADLLTIDAGGDLDGIAGNGYRIFQVSNNNNNTSIPVRIAGLTLTGGDAGIGMPGGAVDNSETLTLESMILEGNATRDSGAAIRNASIATLTINNSTIANNDASRFGGGISNFGDMILNNSTVSGNTAGFRGAGIYSGFFAPDESNTVNNSTITNNTAGQSIGGAFFSGPSVVTSSIIAGNHAPDQPNVGGTITTSTNNLIDVDPLIGPLADNGGATPTHALLPGSPALDAGSLPTPEHVYELNNSLADTNGGPALVANGGTLTATGYDFEPDQGLNLSGALLDPADYTIEIDFSFDAYFSYQSIINFKDLGTDNGLYSLGDTLSFWNSGVIAQSQTVFTANTQHHLVLSRDSVSEVFTVYVDGVELWSFVDSTQATVFDGTNNIIHFFQDNGSEEQAGFVDRLRIYDGAVVVPPNDQRGPGFDRVVGTSADIGAYEAQIAPASDFNEDFHIDGGDFLAWQVGFGTMNAVLADGNSDDDTDVDASDLAAWSVTYGDDTLGTVGGGASHNNVQASLGLNYLIATQGLFPGENFAFQGDGDPIISEIALFAGDFEPAGWQFADGQLLPINQYQALFSIIGTTYGGNGETNFALPDLRGRTTLGEGAGTGLTSRSLGEMTGVETVTLTSSQLPAHSHPLSGVVDTTDPTGGGGAHENVQPSFGMNFMLTTSGLFPSTDGSAPFHNGFIGAVTAFAGTSGFVADSLATSLDGQLLPINVNPAAFSLLGTTYGGNGRTDFGYPTYAVVRQFMSGTMFSEVPESVVRPSH